MKKSGVLKEELNINRRNEKKRRKWFEKKDGKLFKKVKQLKKIKIYREREKVFRKIRNKLNLTIVYICVRIRMWIFNLKMYIVLKKRGHIEDIFNRFEVY